LTNYSSFLETSKKDLIQLLELLSEKHPIKYNLKLEATYGRPNVEILAENRAFKTSAEETFMSKTRHYSHSYFCKHISCFISFNNRSRKNTLSGLAAIDQHTRICGEL